MKKTQKGIEHISKCKTVRDKTVVNERIDNIYIHLYKIQRYDGNFKMFHIFEISIFYSLTKNIKINCTVRPYLYTTIAKENTT